MTLGLSAFLLFWSEPMVGKMVLPHAGGAAAVWTSCVLFFQLMMLAAYLYAHLLGKVGSVRLQFGLHAASLLVPLLFLPFVFTGDIRSETAGNPAAWIVGRLIATVGVPFFVVATTAPLLQKWFSTTRDESAGDPYFLYAASNAGSLAALVLHPLVLEPFFGLRSQAKAWQLGYVLMLGLLGYAILRIRRNYDPGERAGGDRGVAAASFRSRAYWVAAAFVPSALLLAVTNHVSTNVASAPFVWVIPLAAYLLTFIVAFAERIHVNSVSISRVLPAGLLAMLGIILVVASVQPRGGVWIVMAAHIGLFFLCALLAHTALAESRPDPRHLTEFYFWIAFGGVLGGIFAALAAPVMFHTVLEYPLLIAAIPLFRTVSPDAAERFHHRKWMVPAAFALASVSLSLALKQLGSPYSTAMALIAAMMLLIAVYQLKERPHAFAAGAAVIILAVGAEVPRYLQGADRVYLGRNFFGVKVVLDDSKLKLRRFMNGDTVHGIESTEAAAAGEPLAYYHATGPVGDVMRVIKDGRSRRVGVVGLGAGAVAAYGDSRTQMTFFEIDPDSEFIARRFFTFLGRCGTNCRVVIGDGRLELQRVPDSHFDALMLDAFSSDAIPAHLISREALELYLKKLKPDGILLFHVTNRYLDVAGLVSSLVVDSKLAGFIRRDTREQLTINGVAPSIYVAAARGLEHLGSVPSSPGWQPVHLASRRVWTDDYSNPASIIRF